MIPLQSIRAPFILAAACVAGVVTSDATESSIPDGMGFDDARHLLNRVGFGASAREVAAFSKLRRKEAVDRLLSEARTEATTPQLEWAGEVACTGPSFRRLSEAQTRSVIIDNRTRGAEMRGWWIDEMLTTASPLTEKMTLFWHNHFVSSTQKVRACQLMYRQNVILRRNALGSFAELLRQTSRDPAMMIYLDAATNHKSGPNENFAREVFELFTLGEGNYAEQDIREAARAFTGWCLDPQTSEFVFREPMHDDGMKTVLGRSGNLDGDDILDILLDHPRTAEFVVTKLWSEFISPTPDADLVRRVAGEFRESGYEIRTALRELLDSGAFWAMENRGTLVKSPVELVVGVTRQLGIEISDPVGLALLSRTLGQDLFAPPTVRGWPGGVHWINSSTLLARKQFVERIMRGNDGSSSAMPHEMEDELMDMKGARIPMRILSMGGQSLDRLAVDVERWQCELAQAPGITAECLLLAGPPVNREAVDGVSPRDALLGLLLDPVFQLK